MTGTPCGQCGAGWLTVYATRQRGDRVVRYYRCWNCQHVPAANKSSQPQTAEKRRQRRKVRAI